MEVVFEWKKLLYHETLLQKLGKTMSGSRYLYTGPRYGESSSNTSPNYTSKYSTTLHAELPTTSNVSPRSRSPNVTGSERRSEMPGTSSFATGFNDIFDKKESYPSARSDRFGAASNERNLYDDSGILQPQRAYDYPGSSVKKKEDFSKSFYSKTDRPAWDITPSSTTEGMGAKIDSRSNLRKLLDIMSEAKVDIDGAMQEYRIMKEATNPGELTKEDEYNRGKASASFALSGGGATRAMEQERDQLIAEVNELQIENQELKKKVTEMTAKIEEESIKIQQKMESTSHEAKREVQKLKYQIEEMEEKKKRNLQEWKTVIDDFSTKELGYKDEIEKLNKKLEQLKGTVRETEQKRSLAEKEKSEALTRLSKEMGNKLSDKNPNIADLSDSNRPTKLAEKYNELYDNEWTDALEIFGSMEEEAAITILLKIIQTAYQFCEKTASEQLQILQDQLLNPITKRKSGSTSANVVLKDVMKVVAECRKTLGVVSLDELYKEFLAWRSTGKYALQVEDYSKKCLELCWLMVVQDPPVILGAPAEVGDTMDTNTFKEYTQTGTTVSFTVWLPLILHQGGPLLCKGVAQPFSMKYDRRAKIDKDQRAKEPTVDKAGEKSRNTSTYQHYDRKGSGLTAAENVVDDMFASNPSRPNVSPVSTTGTTGTAYDSNTQYGRYESTRQPGNTGQEGYGGNGGPRIVHHHGYQYVFYAGNYYTMKEWDELQQRMVRMSTRGQSDV